MLPALAASSPAMMRSSVVLPQPEGPSRATSSPDSTSRLTLRSAWKSPNCLLTLRISILIFLFLSSHARVLLRTLRRQVGQGLHLALVAPLDHRLDHQRDQGQYGQQRGHGKGRDRLVLV